MSGAILSKTYAEPPICRQEIWRYAGCRSGDSGIDALLDTCLSEVRDRLVYRVCYRELPVTVGENSCDFGTLSLASKQLADTLRGCQRAVLFAATVGVELDRLIARYGRLSPAKALLLQAIGAERIEALCDAFCRDITISEQVGVTRRFSPGYGDLPLETQRDIFALLDCSRQIGLTLNNSLLMSPTKSVTAFIGLTNETQPRPKPLCSACDKQDCAYRGVL